METFVSGIRKLEQLVGDGDLVMGAVVGQAYAAAQHKRIKYLEIPYMAQRDEMIAILSRNAITENGSNLKQAAIEISEMFDDMVATFAPVEKHILRNSTYSYVIDNGQITYSDRARDGRVLGKYKGVPGPYE